MMDASVAPSGQNGMKASKVKAHVADLSKQVPDAEVLVKGKRRRFTKQYKLRILKQVDACTRPGQIGAVLRREGVVFVVSDQVAYAARRGTAGPQEAGSSCGRSISEGAGAIAR